MTPTPGHSYLKSGTTRHVTGLTTHDGPYHDESRVFFNNNGKPESLPLAAWRRWEVGAVCLGRKA